MAVARERGLPGHARDVLSPQSVLLDASYDVSASNTRCTMECRHSGGFETQGSTGFGSLNVKTIRKTGVYGPR